MSNSSDAPFSFSESRVSGFHFLCATLVVALVAGAIALHRYTVTQQKNLLDASNGLSLQMLLTQRMSILATEHYRGKEATLLPALSATAAEALTLHDTLKEMGALPPQTGDAPDKSREAIDRAFTYASSPDRVDSVNDVRFLSSLASKDENDRFMSSISSFLDVREKKIQQLTLALTAIHIALLGLLSAISLLVVTPALRHIARLRETLERISSQDLLTGAHNRASLFKIAAMLISSARRHKTPLTALAIDIDQLKKINDQHGRAVGDSAIKMVAKTLEKHLRNSDALGRTGGGEFCVFLPATDENRAAVVAEKLRLAIENLPFSAKDSIILLRVSVGIAEMQAYDKTPDDMLRAAEAVMFFAKQGGGNRLASASVISEETKKGLS